LTILEDTKFEGNSATHIYKASLTYWYRAGSSRCFQCQLRQWCDRSRTGW